MKKVCVQGLGFVGVAMSVAIATAKNFFFVIGLEKNSAKGNLIVSKINNKKIPFDTTDKLLKREFYTAVKKNLIATVDDNILKEVDTVISNINLDLNYKNKKHFVDFKNLKEIYSNIGKKVKKNTLIILETTVPPGTCENIILPILEKEFKKRGFKKNDINFVYSYERVMPGKNYLNSIKNFWRVYSSNHLKADRRFRNFCSKFINIKNYPMSKLKNLRDVETSKILENSYRATNIAFVQEWTDYAKSFKLDLFSIIKAIKVRPTHNNLMEPGLGVGGYCLTKDPLFGKISLENFSKNKKNEFKFSSLAVECNNNMPNFTYKCIKEKIKNIKNKKILFFGITYKSDVEDTRHSPTSVLAKFFLKEGGKIYFQDDLAKKWEEIKNSKIYNLKYIDTFDIIIFNLKTKLSKKINFLTLKNFQGLIVDVSNSLTLTQKKNIKLKNFQHIFIGDFS